MVNFGLSWGDTSFTNEMNKVTTKLYQDIQNTCHSNNVTVDEDQRVKVAITNSNCDVISGVVLTMNKNQSCASSETLTSLSKTLSTQVAHNISSGTNANISLFGTSISNSMNTVSQQIQLAMKNKCGSNDAAIQYMSDATVTLSGDGDKKGDICKSMTGINQGGSMASQCMFRGVGAATADNTNTQAGSEEDGTSTVLIIFGVFIALIVISVLVHYFRSKAHTKKCIEAHKTAQRNGTHVTGECAATVAQHTHHKLLPTRNGKPRTTLPPATSQHPRANHLKPHLGTVHTTTQATNK